MGDMQTLTTTLSIDFKKNRIRIFKEALHHLGDPKLVQLLVNPEKKWFAIRGVEQGAPSDLLHRISRKRLASDLSIEIYSRSFIESLRSICEELDMESCYHLPGVIVPQKRAMIFALKGAVLFDSDEVCHEREGTLQAES